MAEYGAAAQIAAVQALHTTRSFNGDGYGWAVCTECRQAWPCATEEAIRAATCPVCGGEGYEVQPEAQCGDYEHEHSDGCVVPVQVPCRCTKPPGPVTGEEPF